jgi:hypothetical protein
MNISWNRLFGTFEISADDIWLESQGSSHENTLWNAKLFPIQSLSKDVSETFFDSESVLWMQFPSNEKTPYVFSFIARTFLDSGGSTLFSSFDFRG